MIDDNLGCSAKNAYIQSLDRILTLNTIKGHAFQKKFLPHSFFLKSNLAFNYVLNIERSIIQREDSIAKRISDIQCVPE